MNTGDQEFLNGIDDRLAYVESVVLLETLDDAQKSMLKTLIGVLSGASKANADLFGSERVARIDAAIRAGIRKY